MLFICFMMMNIHPIQAKELYMNSSDSAHQFAFTMITGDTKQLSDYAGHPVLIVNTASKCGLTPQYAELEALYKKYAELGLVVIGVPSDNFGGQEYAEEAEVVAFTQDKFHITFPLTSLNDVKGKNAHPFYQWANKLYRTTTENYLKEYEKLSRQR